MLTCYCDTRCRLKWHCLQNIFVCLSEKVLQVIHLLRVVHSHLAMT